MKNVLVVLVFVLTMLGWAVAQQPEGPPQPESPAQHDNGQSTSPNPRTPDASQSPATPGSAGQDQTRGQGSNVPVTEGCLGGSNPNYTVTDNTGATYKLNIPPSSDASKLASHVGEPVQVMGDVKDSGKATASIDVQGVGRGTGKCPAGGSSPTTQPPKQ